MDLIIQYFDGQPFVSNPYAPGTSLRQDLFERQFTLFLHGTMEFLEDSGRGTYFLDSHAEVGHCGLLDDILPLALAVVRDEHYPLSECVESFSPRRVCVVDRHGHLVLAGKIDGTRRGIYWISPCGSEEEERAVLDRISLLRSQSAFEHGWDNFGKSQRLDAEADLLKGCLVHKPWRKHVRALLDA